MFITLDLKERGGEGLELVGWGGRNGIWWEEMSFTAITFGTPYK